MGSKACRAPVGLQQAPTPARTSTDCAGDQELVLRLAEENPRWGVAGSRASSHGWGIRSERPRFLHIDLVDLRRVYALVFLEHGTRRLHTSPA